MLADRRSFVARVTKVTGLCGTPWLSAAAATATARPLGTVSGTAEVAATCHRHQSADRRPPARRRSHDFFVCVQTYDVRRPRAHVCVCGSDIALSVPDVTCIYECRSVMSNATCQHTDYNGDVLLSNITFLTFAVSHVVFTHTVVLTRNAVV